MLRHGSRIVAKVGPKVEWLPAFFCSRSRLLQLPAIFSASAPVHLDHDGEKWAQKTLKKMSLEEKVGQMFMIRLAMPQFVNLKNPEYLNWLDQIQRYHLGSVLLTVPAEGPSLSKSEPYEAAMLVNQLQRASKLPLLVAADYERGLSMRLNGTTVFPHSMAFGAAGKPEFAEQFGKIVAQESRAIGVQWNLMPIADVNSNPVNPVINTRSFGEDPAQVSSLVTAYIRGARNNGLLTAAKHFPGHGDTSTDSHLGLAAVNRTREQINQIDLPPFRAAIAAGTDAVMVAHITAPVLEPDPSRVATNSPAIVTGILKQQLGFKGLVMTDAMDMAGLTSVYPEGGSAAAKHAAIDTVRAGNDMLILFTDLDGAYKGLLSAVRSGEIPEKRIDESVLKILRAKASVGLNKASQIDINKLSSVISSPENLVDCAADRRFRHHSCPRQWPYAAAHVAETFGFCSELMEPCNKKEASFCASSLLTMCATTMDASCSASCGRVYPMPASSLWIRALPPAVWPKFRARSVQRKMFWPRSIWFLLPGALCGRKALQP